MTAHVVFVCDRCGQRSQRPSDGADDWQPVNWTFAVLTTLPDRHPQARTTYLHWCVGCSGAVQKRVANDDAPERVS